MSAALSAKTKETYLNLVRSFPLRAIRTEYEAVAANDILLKLVTSKPKLNAGEREYVEALTALIRQYESNRPHPELFKSSPLEILKHLMNETGMKISDLGRLIGHQATASQILKGERELSKTHVQKLAGHFNVSTDLFLPRPRQTYRRAS
jgi:antitoxin component HigA of HigAB toxin-antitoxin module